MYFHDGLQSVLGKFLFRSNSLVCFDQKLHRESYDCESYDVVCFGSNTNCLKKSFFYRTHTEWNALPLNIRKIENLSSFKAEVIKYFWKLIHEDIDYLYDV